MTNQQLKRGLGERLIKLLDEDDDFETDVAAIVKALSNQVSERSFGLPHGLLAIPTNPRSMINTAVQTARSQDSASQGADYLYRKSPQVIRQFLGVHRRYLEDVPITVSEVKDVLRRGNDRQIKRVMQKYLASTKGLTDAEGKATQVVDFWGKLKNNNNADLASQANKLKDLKSIIRELADDDATRAKINRAFGGGVPEFSKLKNAILRRARIIPHNLKHDDHSILKRGESHWFENSISSREVINLLKDAKYLVDLEKNNRAKDLESTKRLKAQTKRNQQNLFRNARKRRNMLQMLNDIIKNTDKNTDVYKKMAKHLITPARRNASAIRNRLELTKEMPLTEDNRELHATIVKELLKRKNARTKEQMKAIVAERFLVNL